MGTVRHLGLRLPEDLLTRMHAAAATDRRSLNSWAVVALEQAVAEAELIEQGTLVFCGQYEGGEVDARTVEAARIEGFSAQYEGEVVDARAAQTHSARYHRHALDALRSRERRELLTAIEEQKVDR